jgi:hypothetical protein
VGKATAPPIRPTARAALDMIQKCSFDFSVKRNGWATTTKLVRNGTHPTVSLGAMATENIVLLGSAVVLCGLHVFGGPLSGLLGRNARPKTRPKKRETEEVFARESGANKREMAEHV